MMVLMQTMDELRPEICDIITVSAFFTSKNFLPNLLPGRGDSLLLPTFFCLPKKLFYLDILADLGVFDHGGLPSQSHRPPRL
jgi:hypothetical protein